MTGLPEDVTALLAAVVEALDVPVPANPEDTQARHDLFRKRAQDVLVVVESVVKGVGIDGATAHLREWTAETPVTYKPFVLPAKRGEQS